MNDVSHDCFKLYTNNNRWFGRNVDVCSELMLRFYKDATQIDRTI